MIESHILNARPEFKLPALYLMDSIVKNIREPYVELFTPRVANLFASAYEATMTRDHHHTSHADHHLVAQLSRIRQSLDKLMKTWDTVFPKYVIEAIHEWLRNKGYDGGSGGDELASRLSMRPDRARLAMQRERSAPYPMVGPRGVDLE